MGIIALILYVLLLVGSIFLILLVLIQRGKGGGLAGALGGMGGYSAFGTRAGDLFTKITLVTASIWILAAMALAWINVQGIPYNNPAAATLPRAGGPDDRVPGGESAADDAAAAAAGVGVPSEPSSGARFVGEEKPEGPPGPGAESEAP